MRALYVHRSGRHSRHYVSRASAKFNGAETQRARLLMSPALGVLPYGAGGLGIGMPYLKRGQMSRAITRLTIETHWMWAGVPTRVLLTVVLFIFSLINCFHDVEIEIPGFVVLSLWLSSQ